MEKGNATSLFHYTNTFENLTGILRKGFLPNYCREVMPNGNILGIPMVSFCDIPLTRAGEHRSRYGKFAVGLGEKWGTMQDLNPILYIKSAHLKSSMQSLVLSMENSRMLRHEKIEELRHDPKYKDIFVGFSDALNSSELLKLIDEKDRHLFSFIGESVDVSTLHQMQGYMKLHSFTDDKGRVIYNYDDREWRYIVSGSSEKERWLRGENEYNNWRGKTDKPKPRSTFAPLRFTAHDVQYILVEKESESLKLIDAVNRMKTIGGNEVADDSDRQLLLTKVLSVERLSRDF